MRTVYFVLFATLLVAVCHQQMRPVTAPLKTVSLPTSAARLAQLQGEAATSELKKRGQYGSLMAAVQGSLYGIKPAGREFRAANARHDFSARFDPQGVAVNSVQGHALKLNWQSIERGNRKRKIGPARLVQNGAELQLRRAGATEWFRNGDDGLEQGFSLNQRPEGNGDEVRLTLGVTGLQASGGGDGVDLLDAKGQKKLRYSKLKVWDASGKVLPSRMKASGGKILLALNDRQARYPITVDPLLTAQQAYLKASNTGSGDRFGFSVAMSGDTAVVGAAGEGSSATGVNGNQSDNSFPHSGAVYVFVRSGTTWSQQAYLKASNTEPGDSFGISVAVSGDILVVGAYHESSNATGVNGNQVDNSAFGSGAAYVFTRAGEVWTQQAYLKASNAEERDFFGRSVAVSGNTVVVGAFGESSVATGVNGNQSDNSLLVSGAAYVFVRGGTTWTQEAYLKASNTGAFDYFGHSVAISSDTVVIGALGESSNTAGVNGNQTDDSALYSGAAYVFVRSGTTWAQQAYIKASNTGEGDNFGGSVSISGDTLVVGALNENSNATGANGNQADNTAPDSGAVYVFNRIEKFWTQQAYLKASNPGTDDKFGVAVAVSGNSLVVGTPGEDSRATGVNGNEEDNSSEISGAAHAFVRIGTTWAQQAYLKASNTGTNDQFGTAVGLSGDTVIVGAFQERSTSTGINSVPVGAFGDAGAAYIFTVPQSLSVNNPITKNEGSASTPGSTTFAVSLSGPASQPVSVNYSTTNGSVTAGSDFLAKSGTLTFLPGQTVKYVTVNFIGDAIAEANEKFFLDLKTPSGANLAASRGTAYIRNDDGPWISITDAISINEGDLGTSLQTFVVWLSEASTDTVTVNYATANGTAGPNDFTHTSGTLTFPPGEISKTINVLVKGDTTVEPTEKYLVKLSSPTFAVISRTQAAAYIRNDDTAAIPAEPSG